ncbi:MAG: glycerate kinase [Clostridia bacterium]|nr:glycerate kinase [Clostridia bacterium]
MNNVLRKEAEQIWTAAIQACLPDEAVCTALERLPEVKGRIYLVAIGKAGWKMADTACRLLGDRLFSGIVITKYDHAKGELPRIKTYEAGHPVPDQNTLTATEQVLSMTKDLTADDLVLFLVSGGGSALFESVDCTPEDLQRLTKACLASGASIDEINIVRKHLSRVKGGKFALHCAPAKVFTVLLSDVLGDRPDTIASGPSVPDLSTVEQALSIVQKYGLPLSEQMRSALSEETPKELSNASYFIGGSVRELCRHAAKAAETLGYRPVLLTDHLTCEAREAGAFLASIARTHQDAPSSLAFIAGGETVVHLRGKGLGGRNQELALAAASDLEGLKDTAIFSVGSDGTDGPTDAAGGYVDETTAPHLRSQGVQIPDVLANNDAYHALAKCDSLIFTGATGTNVNDVAVLLIKR